MPAQVPWVLRIAAFTAAAALPLLLGTRPVRAAAFTVSNTNWGTTATTNSLAWALAQANDNPRADTISITPGLAINVDGATAVTLGWLATINDQLTIEGHGATLVGDPKFLSSGGTVYDKYNVDIFRNDFDTMLQPAFSFAKLAPGVSLSINALHSDGLNGYLQLGEGSTASRNNAKARNSVSYGVTAHAVFEANLNSTLNLSQVGLERLNPDLFGVGPAWAGAISGENATLNMVRSSISQAPRQSAPWSGVVVQRMWCLR